MAGTTPVLVHNCDINYDGYTYRGLNKKHPGREDALHGRAVPKGGSATIEQHVGANRTDSVFTSWTDALEVAAFHAENAGDTYIGEGGVILRIRTADIDPPVGPSRNIQVHDTDYARGSFYEDEHLIVGEIHAPEISFDLGETWSKVARG
ncbi:hypothetical protein [Streptomyces sp. NPDC008125]|uniref:hypothetical protein n=1 Tax=Streptomyces sp. NPDC008125 TaxID=3364811 RepID=UPI0036E7DAEB